MKDKHSQVRGILALTLLLNLFVASLKLVFGLLANSLSMLADSAHSFFDSTSNIIGLIGVGVASKPPDRGHPYGHGKYEAFATMGIAALLLITSFGIMRGALGRLLEPVVPEITALTFAVMIVTTIVNVLVSRYEGRRGRELSSQILVADSYHTRSDVYASVSVMLGFLAVRVGYPVFDPLIAVFMGFLIAKTAYRIVRDSATVLCDSSVIDDHIVLKVVESISGIQGCHKIRTRGSEGEIYVDLHMLVPADMAVRDAHELSEQVQEKLKKDIPGVKDVVVHIEPNE
jgi:cation diffusion facilitator family transporter